MFVPLLISTKISMCFYPNFTIKKMERFSVGSELWNRDFVSQSELRITSTIPPVYIHTYQVFCCVGVINQNYGKLIISHSPSSL